MIYLEEMLVKVEEQIDECIAPFQKEIELLDTIPGVNKDSVAVFVADMSVI